MWTLKEVGEHWDRTEDYDEINKKTYSYMRRFVDGFRLSNIKPGSYLLDICCRTGNGSLYFSERIPGLRFLGLDVSENMLKIAKDRLKKGNVKFEVKKFESYKFPLKNKEFDAILCFETLEHIPNPGEFVKELSRVLRKNGTLILTTPNIFWEWIHAFAALTGIHHSEGPHRFLPRKEIKDYLKKNNFEIVKEETTVLIPYGPRFITNIGDFLEIIFKNTLMPVFGLRRIFICRKLEN